MNITHTLQIREIERVIPYVCSQNVWEEATSFIAAKFPRHALVVISDKTVFELYGKIIQQLFGVFPRYAGEICVPSGEMSKNRATKELIEDELFAKKLGRDTALLAVGGGVIGDLAGFVAATFNRGIPLIHLPTTLLAMVDSSIGGKTGINHSSGKNLIGAFYQPEAIFADTSTLITLPEEEFINGMAEVVKYAVTLDPDLWSLLENNATKILAREQNLVQQCIVRSAGLKIRIVEQDEKESGLRAILNFGHTAGHAFEMLSEYKIPHGFAIAAGMRVALRLSCNLLGYPRALFERFEALLQKYSLHQSYSQFAPEALWESILTDKKSRDGAPRFVLMRSQTQYELAMPVTFDQFVEGLKK